MTSLPENPWASALAKIQALLAKREASWAVFGAVAANVYRQAPRVTNDVDILVSLSPDDMRLAARDAEASGWTVRFLHPDGFMLRISHPDHAAVDFVAVEMDYQRDALNRSDTRELANGVSASVLAVEDVIIHKLIANRLQDAADIQAILESQPNLDQDYLNHWIDEWAVRDRFAAIEKAVADANAGSESDH